MAKPKLQEIDWTCVILGTIATVGVMMLCATSHSHLSLFSNALQLAPPNLPHNLNTGFTIAGALMLAIGASLMAAKAAMPKGQAQRSQTSSDGPSIEL